MAVEFQDWILDNTAITDVVDSESGKPGEERLEPTMSADIARLLGA